MSYRLYVDEVGHADMASLGKENQYLSLTGVIFKLDYVRTTAFPAFEELKQTYFGAHPDAPVVLHRREMVKRQEPFSQLADPVIGVAFSQELLELLQRLEYSVMSVVIDKKAYQPSYLVSGIDPYHLCLTSLVERYIHWLEVVDSVGDVMVESRNKTDNQQLRRAFQQVFIQGLESLSPNQCASRITTRDLKIEAKECNNIIGLQIADLIAHPSFISIRSRRDGESIRAPFGRQIAQLLDDTKYSRSPEGDITNWGIAWLPGSDLETARRRARIYAS